MGKVTVNPPKTPVTKGSHGLSPATVPNVCKMPGPPAPFVPTPLPNIGRSEMSPDGYSTTVKIEGEPAAIQGASFKSMGDVASKGTGGGIVSNNVEGATKFVAPGSMTVAIEGKNVQLLGDAMTNNGGPSGDPPNAATTPGEQQAPGPPSPEEVAEKAACECQKDEQPDRSLPKEKQCEDLIDRRGKCVTKKLSGKEKDGIWPNARFKAPEGMTNPKTGAPVTRIVPDLVITAPGSFPASMTSVGKTARANKMGLKPGPVKKVIDFKFPCPPSTKTPFPSPAADGKGYGIETGAGAKELGAYRDLSDPPSDVKVITPNEATCG